MRQVIGQAAGHAGRRLHRVLRALLLVLLVPAAALLGLAWRLDQGPLELPWLTAQLLEAANRQVAPMRLEIGGAALVWEGFSRGVDRPLDLRVRDLAVADAEGRRIAQVPLLDVSLSMRGLLLGRIAPRGLHVQGARVRALRRQDGSLAVDFAAREAGGETQAAEPTAAADLGWVFDALAQPPGFDGEGQAALLAQLRRLQLHDIQVVVQDEALGVVWRTPRLEIDLVRQGSGGVRGTASLELAVNDRKLDVAAQLDLPSALVRPDAGAPPALALAATLASVVPAEFASLSPAFTPLGAVRAPVSLTATAELGADLLPRHGRLQARMAAGSLRIARGTLPVDEGLAEIEGSAEGMRLTLQRLALPTAGGTQQAVLSGAATMRPQGGMLVGLLDLQLDRVGFADLASLWPDGVGGPGAKPWVTGNITAGTATDLRLQVRVVAAPDLSDGAVTHLTGSVQGRDMVVHWLRPVPPTEQVAARLDFVSPNEMEVTVLSGTQAGLAVTGGTVTLTGLAQRDQYLNLALDASGPVADLLTILNHPRVNILSRRPIPMRNPSGRMEGRLAITALPLENDLTFDDVRLSATGRLSALNLGGIAAGRDLTNGAFTFETSNDGLRAQGSGSLAAIPAQIAVEMDFTDGPPSQVIQKVTVSGTADAARLVDLGLDTSELALDGAAALKLDLVGRRSGRSDIAVRADLARLGLRADRLNWSKPAGRPATAEAQLVLERERFAGIERLRVEGEGVSVQAALDWPAGGQRRLRLTRAVLGAATNVQGEIQWPRAAGQPWQVRLSGPSLDITGEMARQDPVKPGEEVRGPPWNAELRVDRLVLAPGRIMSNVLARSDNDGLITRSARVAGRAGTGAFELSILPSGLPRQRSLTITAQDAGGLLAALDVTDQIRGGRLVLNGAYDDTRPDHLISGTAEVTEFGVRDAPVVAKLLQAITVVGAFEAFSGPDLRFSRMVAPFRYRGDMIEMADARAFSATLGLTVKGRIDMARRLFDLQGTVVPAYFLNSLLGRVPLIGKLVSPEAGGGLFAMNYSVAGGFDDPTVRVNPLSAVTPGFLRGIFSGAPGGGADGSVPLPQAPRDGGRN